MGVVDESHGQWVKKIPLASGIVRERGRVQPEAEQAENEQGNVKSSLCIRFPRAILARTFHYWRVVCPGPRENVAVGDATGGARHVAVRDARPNGSRSP